MPPGRARAARPRPEIGRTVAGDVTEVRTVRRLDQHPGQGYDRLWEPYVAEASPAADGRPARLVVAFGAHLDGKVDMGDVLCCVSSDGGQSWSDPVAVFDHRLPLGPLRVAYANPILFRPPGQSIIWCYAMRCPLSAPDSENSQLCAAYSADGGGSWQPVELAVFLHEGGLAPGERAGELQIVMRTADYRTTTQLDPPVAYSSVSTDGGRTWSLARPEPELPNSVSKAYFGRDAAGRHVYVYSAGPQRERRALHYRVKRPGEGWGERRAFYDPGVKNSYPTLLEYAPGRFHCVWDSSDTPDRPRTLIRYGRLDLGAGEP